MKKNKSKISGLSILEALVSTAIVGIGFIAILQMTNFSAQSIDNSGDRTKANYLTEMIAEDVISSRDSLYGVKSDNSNIVFKDGWEAELNCENLSTDSGNTNDENIYETQDIDAPSNKEAKWDAIFNKNRFLKCKSNNETKKLETFEICRWDGCAYKNDLVFDDPIYISRVEMLLNNGKKRKYLYFQSDYKIKTTTGGSEDSDSLD